MSRVSVAIQAHPRRAAMAEALLGCLDGRAEIVYDPEPEIAPRSPWRTYRRALELAPAWAAHRLVLQEDALICDRFLDGVEAASRARPGRVLVFFVGGRPLEHGRAIRAARERGWSWAELENRVWCPAVATAWPTDLIPKILGFVDAQTAWPAGFVADDEILGKFLLRSAIVPLASVPSLVEHPDTAPSLIRSRPGDGKDASRRAYLWIGDLGFCDATLIDWTLGPGG